MSRLGPRLLLPVLPLLSLPGPEGDPDPLRAAVREIRAIRSAEAVFAGRVVKVHPTPGVWCGIAVVRQEVTWRVEESIDGTPLAGEFRVGHLLVAGSPLVAANAPFLRPDLFHAGARAVLCVSRDAGEWIVPDETFGVRMVDGARPSDPRRTAVLQAALGAEGLRTYLHLDRPERVPPCIALDEVVPLPLDVTCFGHAVDFLPLELAARRPHLRIESLPIEGDSVQVRIRIPFEGVLGEVSLTESDGEWSIAASEFVER